MHIGHLLIFQKQENISIPRKHDFFFNKCFYYYVFTAATGAIFPYTILMSWWGGQTYCQTHHTDLARAITSTQNSQLQQVAATQGTSWFGLFRDPWMWSDWATPSVLRWGPGLPNNVDHNDNCAMTTNNQLVDRQCNNLYNFFCHIRESFGFWVTAINPTCKESIINNSFTHKAS